MKFPSMIKGWLNPVSSPEKLLTSYFTTGKQHYLTQLVEQFNISLFHYLLSQSDKASAEDILQTTWLKVVQAQVKSKQIRRMNINAKSWLFTIARNSLIDELKRQNRWRFLAIDELPLTEQKLHSTPLEQSVASQDKLTLFNLAIEQLPFHQREVFIFQQEGFSLLEIATLTDENFETVKSRLRYARQSIKQILRTTL